MDVSELIFEMYKDKVIMRNKLRPIIEKQYKLSVTKISDIFSRIINYQIKTYGARLSSNPNDYNSKEELIKRKDAARHRYRQALNRKGGNKK